MQCEKFDQRLQQLLDARENVNDDDMLRQHAEACAGCRSTLRTQRDLFAALQVLPQDGQLKHMGHRVLDGLQAERKHRRKRRRTMFALALAVVLLIALIPFAGRRDPSEKNGRPGKGSLAMTYVPTSPIAKEKLSESEAEEIRVLVRHLVKRLSDPGFEMFDSVDQLTSGIRPLAATFNYAFDTLRRTLPGYSAPNIIEPQARFSKVWTSVG